MGLIIPPQCYIVPGSPPTTPQAMTRQTWHAQPPILGGKADDSGHRSHGMTLPWHLLVSGCSQLGIGPHQTCPGKQKNAVHCILPYYPTHPTLFPMPGTANAMSGPLSVAFLHYACGSRRGRVYDVAPAISTFGPLWQRPAESTPIASMTNRKVFCRHQITSGSIGSTIACHTV